MQTDCLCLPFNLRAQNNLPQSHIKFFEGEGLLTTIQNCHIAPTMDMLIFYFYLMIALILKYKEELINYPDGGRKLNSSFNEYNLSRICNDSQR